MFDITEMEDAYEQSGLEGSLMTYMPDTVVIDFSESEEAYEKPDDETNADFLDRIERSQKAGRNLFREEWEPYVYEEGAVY